MKKRIDPEDSLKVKETKLEELAEPEPNDSVNQHGSEFGETKLSDEMIKKLLPLAGSMGASLAGALLPGSLLGLSGSLFGASRLAPGVLNSLVNMLVGAGAYHALANIEKDFPDLGAPRFEDAIFQILQSDHSPVGFFVKNLSNKYVYLNKAMACFVGKPLTEVIGKTDSELFPEEDQTSSARNFELVIGGQMVHVHRERIVEGAPTTLQEIMVAKRGNRYEPVGVYGVSWAVTEPSEIMNLSEIDDASHTSQFMRLTLRECLRLAKTETHVLLTGERGSGKDYLANYIHDNSNRSNKEILAVNCSDFTAELMSSELFGHVKGAFSGATRDNPGIISAANGSTLFLNEIGELSLQLQSRLLSFLDNGTFRRVGDKGTKKADVRVIAATNKDLET